MLSRTDRRLRREQVVAEWPSSFRQEPLVISSYLLAPGYFFDRISAIAGPSARVVTRPLAPDEAVAQIAVRRYRAAVGL